MNDSVGISIEKLNSYLKNLNCQREHVTESCSSYGRRTFSRVVSTFKEAQLFYTPINYTRISEEAQSRGIAAVTLETKGGLLGCISYVLA